MSQISFGLWTTDPKMVDCFWGVFEPEKVGGYSCWAIGFPEVVSQGETLQEARDNILEAFLAVREAKLDHQERLQIRLTPPARVMDDVPAGSALVKIAVPPVKKTG